LQAGIAEQAGTPMAVKGKEMSLFEEGLKPALPFSFQKYPGEREGLAPRPGRIFAQRKFEMISCKRIIRVEHVFEIKPLGRADRATGGAGAGVEGGLDVFGRPRAGADAFQCAHDRADLIV